MPLSKDTDEPVRIELPTAGEWVGVRPFLSRGQRTDVQKLLVGDAELSAGADKLNAAAAIEAATFAVLNIAIRTWSFDEAVTPENIRRLGDADVRVIEKAIDELYDVRTEAEKKASSSDGAKPSEEKDESPASSPGSP